MDTHRYLPIIIYIIIIFFIYNIYIYVLLDTATHISCITSILLSQCTTQLFAFSVEGVATKVNLCMSTCMCICTMLYSIVLHFFTYLNKMFVAFDQWGSNKRGSTVYPSWIPTGTFPHIYIYVLLYTATHISCITSILLSQCTCTI